MNKFNCSYTEALSIAANDFGIQKIPNLKKNTVKLTEEKHAEIVRELERTWGKDNK